MTRRDAPSLPPTAGVSEQQQPTNACSVNALVTEAGPEIKKNTDKENGACVALPERQGLGWSDEQYADRYARNEPEWKGDARFLPSDCLRDLKKLARRLVSRSANELVSVYPPSLRCDAPKYAITVGKLIATCDGFMEQFIYHPDALDNLARFPYNQRYIVII